MSALLAADKRGQTRAMNASTARARSLSAG
jgi:hypothetical protein